MQAATEQQTQKATRTSRLAAFKRSSTINVASGSLQDLKSGASSSSSKQPAQQQQQLFDIRRFKNRPASARLSFGAGAELRVSHAPGGRHSAASGVSSLHQFGAGSSAANRGGLLLAQNQHVPQAGALVDVMLAYQPNEFPAHYQQQQQQLQLQQQQQQIIFHHQQNQQLQSKTGHHVGGVGKTNAAADSSSLTLNDQTTGSEQCNDQEHEDRPSCVQIMKKLFFSLVLGTIIAICWVMIIHTLKWIAIRGNELDFVNSGSLQQQLHHHYRSSAALQAINQQPQSQSQPQQAFASTLSASQASGEKHPPLTASASSMQLPEPNYSELHRGSQPTVEAFGPANEFEPHNSSLAVDARRERNERKELDDRKRSEHESGREHEWVGATTMTMTMVNKTANANRSFESEQSVPSVAAAQQIIQLKSTLSERERMQRAQQLPTSALSEAAASPFVAGSERRRIRDRRRRGEQTSGDDSALMGANNGDEKKKEEGEDDDDSAAAAPGEPIRVAATIMPTIQSAITTNGLSASPLLASKEQRQAQQSRRVMHLSSIAPRQPQTRQPGVSGGQQPPVSFQDSGSNEEPLKSSESPGSELQPIEPNSSGQLEPSVSDPWPTVRRPPASPELGSLERGPLATASQVAAGLVYRAPFFTSWFVSIWNILFMPVFTLISSCCFRNEDSTTKKLLVRESISQFMDNGLTTLQFLGRCAFFSVLWIGTIFGIVYSLSNIDATVVMALFACSAALVYLLSWVLLHQQFVGVRIVAVIICTTGIALLAYMDNSRTLGSVLIVAGSALCSAVYKVIYQRMFGFWSIAQMSLFFTLIGLFNALLMWPIVLLLYFLGVELIVWRYIPWMHLTAAGALHLTANIVAYFGPICSYDVFLTMGLLLAVVLSAVIDVTFYKINFTGMKLAGVLLLMIGFLVCLLPENWNEFLYDLVNERFVRWKKQRSLKKSRNKVQDLSTGQMSRLRTPSGRVK